MIEIIIKEFLESKLSVPVLMEVPKNPVTSFVIIEKTGSSFENQIPSSIITIQSYASTLYGAAELNEQVKGWMMDGINGLVTLDQIANVTLNSDYNYTDTSEKRYRYQAVFDITHY